MTFERVFGEYSIDQQHVFMAEEISIKIDRYEERKSACLPELVRISVQGQGKYGALA